MSLVNLAHVCSHLQNASKARLGLTSVPVSKMHAALMLQLQRQGFLSSVVLGGPTPPLPPQHQPNPADAPNLFRDRTTGTILTPFQAGKLAGKDRLDRDPRFEPVRVEDVLAEAPWAAYALAADSQDDPLLPPDVPQHADVPSNAARRRLWLGLKYWNNEPVLRSMRLVSKPTKRIHLNHVDLKDIVLGRTAGYVKGLTKTGECMFVSTDRGILEARECVETRTGGMLLCRVH